MNKKYKFKYKKSNSPFWKTEDVIGHSIEYAEDSIIDENNHIVQKIKKPQNSMILYLEDGSIKRISKWDTYDLYLGLDWVLVTKEAMQKEAGQNIPLNV
jgi:hypothetical protein